MASRNVVYSEYLTSHMSVNDLVSFDVDSICSARCMICSFSPCPLIALVYLVLLRVFAWKWGFTEKRLSGLFKEGWRLKTLT